MAGRDLNKFYCTGWVRADPQQYATRTTFPLAINREWWVAGTKKTGTVRMGVIAWDERATACAQLLRQGTRVYIEGYLHNHPETRNLELVVDFFEVLRHPDGGKTATRPTGQPPHDAHHASRSFVYQGMPDASLPPELGAFQMQGGHLDEQLPFADSHTEDDDATP